MTKQQRFSRAVAVWMMAVMGLSLLSSSVWAEAPASAPADGDELVAADDIPLPGEEEELLAFQDMPVVISASRQETTMEWLSIPTSIITAEDIHYSGLTNIPELLRYVPGMDVLKVERWRYDVGIRGMQDFLSDRMLTLIDGRDATNTVSGGPEFFRYPVLMEDIKRIEVVRGPGGAAWGANAFNGVINIITKDPEDCLGFFASTTWSQFADSYSHVRWAAKANKWSWMLSAGYEDNVSSEDALHHASYRSDVDNYTNVVAVNGDIHAQDAYRNARFDGKFIYRLSDDTKATFGSGYSGATMGDYPLGLLYPPEHGRAETSRSFARIDTRLSPRSDLHIQWFTNFSRTNIPSFMTHKDLENDLEVQYDLRTKHHKLTTGGNVRWVHIQDQSQIGQVQVEDSPFNEYWAGLFVIDRWQVTDRFTLEGQFRGDYYSGTRSDWSARVSGLYALDKAKRHILRVSGAKAFRTPLVGLRRGSLSQVRLPLPTPPFPPNLYAFNLLRSRGELENEETASVELGYTGQFTKHLAFRANGYFQRYDKLIDYLPLEGDPLGFGRAFYQVKRTGGANAWGAELELELKGKPGKLSAWYAYNALRLDHQGFYEQNMRMDYLPARHKVGITGRLNLPWGMVFNTNYRFTSATNSLYDIAGLAISHHLDLTLTKKVEIGKAEGEFMIGVNDLFRYRREPAYSMGDVVEHDTPGRTFFARFQVKF